MVLKNAVKIQSLKDPVAPATAILKRITTQQAMELYDVTEFSTPDEFFALLATRMGKFKRGGVQDSVAAARSILEDWNSGKIRYYTVPPEQSVVHLSAGFVTKDVEEFNDEKFMAEERMMLDKVESDIQAKTIEPVLMESTGPVVAKMEIEVEKQAEIKLQKKKVKQVTEAKASVTRKKKADPLTEIEGNQKLNQLNKLQFKKQKKDRVRKERVATNLAGQLESFNLNMSDNYDFDADFSMENK